MQSTFSHFNLLTSNNANDEKITPGVNSSGLAIENNRNVATETIVGVAFNNNN
jgi:hypothetical protein